MLARAVALLLALAAGAQAQDAEEERIVDWSTTLVVEADGRLTVSDSVKIVLGPSEVGERAHREFPTVVWTAWGLPVDAGVEVLEVEVDGRPGEASFRGARPESRVERLSVALPARNPGEHIYTIRYVVPRAIESDGRVDRLEWEVTGVRQALRIDRVRAVAILPGAVDRSAVRLDGFTGRRGERGGDLTMAFDDEGRAVFESSRALDPVGRLTAMLEWPAGVVGRPPPIGVLESLGANPHIPCLVAGAVALLLFVIGGQAALRGPPSGGPSFGRTGPPDPSPAAARYVDRMGFDRDCLVASIAHLAARGAIAFEEADGCARLVPAGAIDRLSEEDAVVRDALVGDGEPVELGPAGAERLRAARRGLAGRLEASYGDHFVVQRRWVVRAAALAVASILTSLAVAFSTLGGRAVLLIAFLTVWLSGWTVGTAVLVSLTLAIWWRIRTAGLKGIPVALVMTLFATPFASAEVFALARISEAATPWYPALVGVLGLLVLVAHLRFRSRTVVGAGVQEAIDGHRAHLTGLPPADVVDLGRIGLETAYAVALGLPVRGLEVLRQSIPRIG